MYATYSDNSCTWIWWCLIIICIIFFICLSSMVSAANNSYNYITSLGINSWPDVQNKLMLGILGPYVNKYIIQSINSLGSNVKQSLVNSINNGKLLNSPIYQQIKSEIIPKIDQEIKVTGSVPANIKNYINDNILSQVIDTQFVQDSDLIKSIQQ